MGTIIVPAHEVGSRRYVATPIESEGGGATDLAAHEAAPDPHPGYTLEDADLAAIAALATTTFGRSFLVLADAAAGRTQLGLGSAAVEASSAFDAAGAAAAAQAASQPLDSDLTAIAALMTTPFGRSLLTLADAAAVLAAIGAAAASHTHATYLEADT